MLRIAISLDLIGGYGREVLRGLMQYGNLVGNWEFLMPEMYSRERGPSIWDREADGVVAMVHDEETIQAVKKWGGPVVNVAHTLEVKRLSELGLASVLPDDAMVGRMAFDYFRDRGFRSFGFCGHPTVAWSRVREEAFVGAVGEAGFPVSVVRGADAVPHGWVKTLGKTVGLLAANDRYAWHAIDACRAGGIRVPEDLAVLGVDNDVLLDDLVRPSLSSIKPAAFQVGIEAGRLLTALMDGGTAPARAMVIPPEGFVTRNSTDVLTLEDEAVVSAVRFIRLNADKPISVEDVQRDVMISRRNLERRFKLVLGRSLLQEIRRVRIERACDLLRDTDFDMQLIAERCGFQSQIRFSTVFGQVRGVSPSGYRKKHRATR